MYNELSMLNYDYAVLESAVGAYDAMNGITPEVLSDLTPSYEGYYGAYESANNDFSAGLFGDDCAMEAADDKDKKVGLGAKIKSGFQNIIAAIKKGWESLVNNVKTWFAKLKEKKNKAVAASNPAVKAYANSSGFMQLRNKIQKVISLLGNNVKSNSEKIKAIVDRINKAIDGMYSTAGVDSTSTNGYNATASGGAVLGKSIKDSYKNDKGADENTKEKISGRMEADVATCEKIVDEVAANVAQIKDLTKDMQEEYNNLLKKAADGKEFVKMNVIGLTQTSEESDAEFKKRRQAEANKLQGDERNTAKGVGSPAILKMAYFSYLDLATIEGYITSVTSACDKHKRFCETFVNNTSISGSSDTDVKCAYRFAQLYMKASSEFTKMSTQITFIQSIPTGVDTSDSALAKERNNA